MVVPRSWTSIEKQRDLTQTLKYAEPMATDPRFKLGALFLFIGWLTTSYSLIHSIKHYKPSTRHLISRLLKSMPTKFLLTLPLALITIGYEAAISFEFSISPLKLGTHLGFMYGLGWAPIALILLIYEVAGYKDPNEDRVIIRQRRIRGAEIDAEIGIAMENHWWTQSNHTQDHDMSVQAQIARNVFEVGGGTATAKNTNNSVEMRRVPGRDENNGKSENHPLRRGAEATNNAANMLFPAVGYKEESKKGRRTGNDTPHTTLLSWGLDAKRAMSRNSSTSITASPQKIRSMLDV